MAAVPKIDLQSLLVDKAALRKMLEEQDRRTGVLVEYDRTDHIFTNPSDERTENYVTGRFG